MRPLYFNLRRAAALVVGVVFFMAGVFKLMDPVGDKLMLDEYLKFFHLGFLSMLSMPLAMILALFETVLGISLVVNVFRKVVAFTTLIVMGIFTIVTLILLIANPHFDCGCFGEVVHLTHFQSLVKNLVLDALAVFAFVPFRDFGSPKKTKYIPFALVAASVPVFMIYSLVQIPLIDFTPYNSSTTLAAAVGEDMAAEKSFVSTFIYEKNGQRGTFTLDRLPDSTWTYVSTEVIEKEVTTAPSEFPQLSFRDASGAYRDTLASSGQAFVVSSYDPSYLSPKKWRRIYETLHDAASDGFTSILLLATSPLELDAFLAESSLASDEQAFLVANTYYSDYKTLVSLNRGNGAGVYFNDGNLIRKWSHSRLPSSKALSKLYRQDSIEVMVKADTKGRMTFHAYLLYAFAIMLLL